MPAFNALIRIVLYGYSRGGSPVSIQELSAFDTIAVVPEQSEGRRGYSDLKLFTGLAHAALTA